MTRYPYVRESLSLKEEYSESDLEDALIHRLGGGITRQKGRRR